MLTVIYGYVGSGKTLLLTIIGYYSEKPVISNYSLNFPYEEFKISKFVKSEYENNTVLLDEAYVYIESRLSMSNKNKAFSYILFQSRKKSVDLVLTVQLVNTLDSRFRNLFDYIIYAHGNDGLYYYYTVVNRHTSKIKNIKLPIVKAVPFYNLFNTNEVIKPDSSIIDQFTDITERQDRVKVLYDKFLKKYPNNKITKNLIKLFLFENDIPNNYIDIIYAKLKLREENENDSK